MPENTPVTIVIEACYSGNFIRTGDDKPTSLVGRDRTIIVSTRGDKQAKILPNGSSFSKLFFDGIGANRTLCDAFREAEQIMERIPAHCDQYPQMDADGDGNINTPQDYVEGAHRYLPVDMVSLAAPPEIIDITPSQTLPESVSSLRIRVELIGAGITRVSAIIIPPDFDPTMHFDDWSNLNFPELELAKVSEEDNRYEYAATYADFTTPGDYTVIVDAENQDGSSIPVQTTITVSSGVGTTITKGDLDKDGKVSSKDAILVLRIVAGLIEPAEYQIQAADMNGDGKIKADDAIIILRKVAGLAAPEKMAQGRAAMSQRVTISLGETYGLSDGSMIVPLILENATQNSPVPLAGGEICITYDPAVLRIVEISNLSGIWGIVPILEPHMQSTSGVLLASNTTVVTPR